MRTAVRSNAWMHGMLADGHNEPAQCVNRHCTALQTQTQVDSIKKKPCAWTWRYKGKSDFPPEPSRVSVLVPCWSQCAPPSSSNPPSHSLKVSRACRSVPLQLDAPEPERVPVRIGPSPSSSCGGLSLGMRATSCSYTDMCFPWRTGINFQLAAGGVGSTRCKAHRGLLSLRGNSR